MKVYVALRDVPYEFTEILGCYASRELAMEALKIYTNHNSDKNFQLFSNQQITKYKNNNNNNNYIYYSKYEEFLIQEFELNMISYL